jgi:hypothetical protein
MQHFGMNFITAKPQFLGLYEEIIPTICGKISALRLILQYTAYLL